MHGSALTHPRAALATARRAGCSVRSAVAALPRIAALLGELTETGRQLERLSTFAAGELPEIIHQLEGMRRQLSAIERRLDAAAVTAATTPDSRRTG